VKEIAANVVVVGLLMYAVVAQNVAKKAANVIVMEILPNAHVV